MAKVLVNEINLTNIANAIREKNGTVTTYKPSEMASAISSIETGSGKYAPRYMAQSIIFRDYTGSELDHETTMIDTTNFADMSYMFDRCRNLTRLDLSSWNTSNVTNMMDMFSYCDSLTSLDLSSFDTSKVTDMYMMFRNCSDLTYLDIRNFTFDSVTSYSNIFTGIPADCLIIVKGETEKAWVLARRSTLTNIKTVAEYETS